jgi:hypothetical protein
VENVKSIFALIVTVAILTAGAVFVVYLLGHVGVPQSQWDRYIYLLTGVEAVVFAGVGWLFGKEVHREQAQKAEDARKIAESERTQAATKAATEEEKGKQLANAILSTSETQQDRRDALGRAGVADVNIDRGMAVDSLGIAQLVAQAKRAYPGLN